MERLATRTLADIYLQQGHFQEAYEIFKILLEKDPNNTELQDKLRELNEKLTFPPSNRGTAPSPKEEKIRLLKKWLANIQERRRTQ
jgi:tetratricopeptide (TPR) repeat protein